MIETVNALRKLFVNRDDCYAVQLESGSYTRVDKPLTDDVLEKHLQGKITVGSYQLTKENMVTYLCFDLDPEHLDDPKVVAEKIIEVCLEKLDNEQPRIWPKSILLEASRYPDPSFHIWIIFWLPVPAKATRWLGLRILELANLNPKQIEVFPKQDELTEAAPYGNFVKLPLGFHRVEKKWSRLLNPETFEPLPLEHLLSVEGISFSEADLNKVMGFEDKRHVQTALALPRKFKALSSREEEKTVNWLIKYWKLGFRNQLEMSFLGLCLKRGVNQDSAKRIIEAVADATGDDEKPARLALVDYHYRNRLKIPLKGKSGLRELLGALKHEDEQRT